MTESRWNDVIAESRLSLRESFWTFVDARGFVAGRSSILKHVVRKKRRAAAGSSDDPDRLDGGPSRRRQGEASQRGRPRRRRRKHGNGPDKLPLHEADRETTS